MGFWRLTGPGPPRTYPMMTEAMLTVLSVEYTCGGGASVRGEGIRKENLAQGWRRVGNGPGGSSSPRMQQ